MQGCYKPRDKIKNYECNKMVQVRETAEKIEFKEIFDVKMFEF